MQPIYSQVTLLAVTLAFFLWRTCGEGRRRRQRVLRERVAYMLWVAAVHAEPSCRLAEAD
jgi:hypothetical protein